MRERLWTHRKIFFFRLFLGPRNFFRECLRMKLLRQIFYGRNNAGRRPVYSITNNSEMAMSYSIEDFPARERGERFHLAGNGFRMRIGKDQVIRLEMRDFFEADLRPIVRGVDDGYGAGAKKCVRDKGVTAG